VYFDPSLNWVLENVQLQAEVRYSMIVVNALSLFTLHGSASVPDDAMFVGTALQMVLR
jgi:hypothetical protein